MIVSVRIEVYDDTELENIEDRIGGALQGVDCTYDVEEEDEA